MSSFKFERGTMPMQYSPLHTMEHLVTNVLTHAQSTLKPRCPYGKYLPPSTLGGVTPGEPLTTRAFVERFLRLYTTTVELSGLGRVILRPITPNCRELIREGIKNMSERSRYLRFCRNLDELSEYELKYLTEIDFENHFALGAALETDDGKIVPIGSARYVRLKDKRNIAEVAVAVVDTFQHKGIGKLILLALAVNAQIQGIDTFRVFVHPSNVVVLQVVRDCSAQKLWQEDGMTCADCPVIDLVPRLCANGIQFTILSGPNMISPWEREQQEVAKNVSPVPRPLEYSPGGEHQMPPLMRHGFVGDL